MPILKTELIILPDSKIKCQIGFSFFEQVELQYQATTLGKLTNKNFNDYMTWQKQLILTGVKSWDSQLNGQPEPLNDQAVNTMSKEDVEDLVKHLMRHLNPPPPDTGDKKKDVNMPERSKEPSEAPTISPPAKT